MTEEFCGATCASGDRRRANLHGGKRTTRSGSLRASQTRQENKKLIIELVELPVEERQAVERHFRFARSLQIETRAMRGRDIAKTVVEFGRRNQITQIFVAHSQVRLGERLRGTNFSENIVRLAQDLQVTVVADRSRKQGS